MRGIVPGLETPHPLLHQLPGVYQDSDFTERFVSAFDDALAPVFSTLDNISAYIDPETAPEDFLAFVGSWVGAIREDWTPLPAQRLAVRDAVLTHRARGTAGGLGAAVRHLTGGAVTVTDSGATAWSTQPGGALPGTFPAQVRVRIAVNDPDALDVRLVEAVVSEAIPPHVAYEIEVVRR